jgi:replication-associated recombination protein RarA
MPLFEDYRPQHWADFVGNTKAVTRLKAVTKRSQSTGKPFAVWIDGPSGTGKTTLAHLIAKDLNADPAMDVIELDGPECDGHAVRDLRTRLDLKSWKGGFRVVIVNEAHNCSPKGVQLWLTLLERLGPKVAVCFTTTEGRNKEMFGAFDGPLKSRCIPLSLTSQGLAEAFAQEAQRIAELEGLGGAEPKEYLALVRKHKNNMRAVLSEIEGFEMHREPAHAS